MCLRAAVITVAISLFSIPSNGAGTISVSGDALLHVVPDEVVVGLGVEVFNPSLDEAKRLSDRETRSLLTALRDLGIAERDIQTDTLEVELRYRDSVHPSAGIEGYHARRAFSITLKDPSKVEATIDKALHNGANRIMGYERRTTKLREYRDEARRKAIRAAREKAELLAGELGMKVGAASSISEGWSRLFGGQSSFWGWGGNWGQANVMQNVSSGGSSGESPEMLPLGEVGVYAQVSVVFELAGRD